MHIDITLRYQRMILILIIHFTMRRPLYLIAILGMISTLSAQRHITVKGNIYDRLTSKDLPHVKVKVLNTDSTVAAETDAYRLSYTDDGNYYKEYEEGLFSLEIPMKAYPYIIRFSKDGYETISMPLDLSNMTKRQFELKLPPIYMTPIPSSPSINLNELVVKTSKVKFYHKGDTLIYNADAFMMPQGSTLDALITKLPGVEIREGGKIYVNGKFVESLMLNGKDFFKGNQDVLRRNLGAYTVKNIAVYNKYGQMSTLMETQIEDDNEYVMDVRLKKDYMGGFMGNAWLSFGTDKRYLGRLFAMHFNNNARFALYGNVNNINEIDRPNDGYGFNSNQATIEGVSKISNGGFDYLIEDPHKVWSIGGNVDAKYFNNVIKSNVFLESFLQHNSFQTTLSDRNHKEMTLYTRHEGKLNKEFYYFNIKPEFNYNRTLSTFNSASVEFDSNVQEKCDIDIAVINALYTGTQRELTEALINRNRYEQRNRSNYYRGYFWSEQGFRFKGSPDAFNVWIEGEYNREHSRSLVGQTIDYGFNDINAPISSTALRRENQRYPTYTGWLKGAFRYYIRARKTQFTLGYEYRHEKQRRSSVEFLLNSHLQDEEAYLPPDTHLKPDLSNTYKSNLQANVHMIKGSFDYSTEFDSSLFFKLSVTPEFQIRSRSLHYNTYSMEAGERDCPLMIPVARTSCSFNNSGINLSLNTKDYRLYFNLEYKMHTIYSNLADMIDIPNTVDPLNISHGNPNIKDAFRQNLVFNFTSNPTKNTSITVNSYFNYISRDQTRGYTFDSNSGVRNFKTVNVSGNLSNSESANFYKALGFGNHELSFNINANYEFTRYANMIGEDGPMRKQVVLSNHFGYSTQIRYGLMGRYSISCGFNGMNIFSHTNSRIQAGSVERRFIPKSILELRLPHNIYFLGEMNYLIIQGTNNIGMNPNQCIVNATISYSLGEHWIFRIEGHDLLNQQKPYTNIVTASGRTQTIVNNLPRYIMFTIGYNFNSRKEVPSLYDD